MSEEPQELELSEAKQRVLDTAESLFIEHGYAAITLRDIAEALGIKQASLYYHYPDGKEQMYVEMIERVFHRHRFGMEEAVATAAPEIEAQLSAVTQWLASQPTMNFLGMMYADLPALSTANARRLAQAAYRDMFFVLREVFAAAGQSGEVRTINPDLYAGFFLALMDGITFSLTQSQTLPRQAMDEEVIRMMLDGIRPRKRDGAGE
jgi:AcrR family transcriptional regulator